MKKEKPHLNEYLKEQYSIISNMEERKHLLNKSQKVMKEDGRNEYQRDYARILYSSSFRRLQGKMQFLGLEAEQFFRNRLTHSLEVSQISESIISVLNSKIEDKIYTNDDIYVVRAACLAHDLGNPPFGHAGEKELNNLMKDAGGFEGNAQTLRILNEIEKKDGKNKGLNLTYRTQLALLKYYNTKEKYKEKFIYDEDYNEISEYINKNKISDSIRTLDAQIMDISDEIAYSAHDLEDCLSLKVFDIDEFLYELKRKDENCFKQFKIIVDKAKEQAMESDVLGTTDEYNDILRKSITSMIVDKFVRDVGVVKIKEEDKKKFGTKMEFQLGLIEYSNLSNNLKKITFESLKRRKYVKKYEEKGKKIIQSLFKLYEKCPEFMSYEYEIRYKNEKNEKRVICDYISGMMDIYAVNKYKEYFGEISFNYKIEENRK